MAQINVIGQNGGRTIELPLPEVSSGVYSFWVSPKATKTEIKSAIQQAFGVTVVGISTMNVPGKRKRVGRFIGQRNDRKKAIVRLAEGQSIEALAGQA